VLEVHADEREGAHRLLITN